MHLGAGFGSDAENPHLPHNHERNQVVYTGTHDNDTVNFLFDYTIVVMHGSFYAYGSKDPCCPLYTVVFPVSLFLIDVLMFGRLWAGGRT